MPRSFIMLGRNGDILNAAKICHHEHLLTGQKVPLIVAKEFAPVLGGFSYIEPIIFDGTQDELPRAMALLPGTTAIQSWKNPDQSHQTDSYQKEAWRRAGKLDAFGTVGLHFDRRNPAREAEFVNRLWSPTLAKPLILVATQSPSSPFKLGEQLIKALNDAFRDTHTVVDLSMPFARAPMPYDLLGLFNRAALLVTIDTFHLHLAEASTCPVIAILNDAGTSATPGSWAASVPPPQTVETLKYSEFEQGGFMELVVMMALNVLRKRTPKIIHTVDLHGQEPRHNRAKRTWATESGSIFDFFWPFMVNRWNNSSMNIGDTRALPFLKDLLAFIMKAPDGDDDIIFWCNDDNSLSPELPAFLRKHIPLYGACSFRRTEDGSTGHVGRDAFAFTKRWLTQHWDSIPDYLLGFGQFDIGLAALIRLERGVVTTNTNLAHDFFPCDIGLPLVMHEKHASEWAKNMDSPGNRWNRAKFREWSAKHLPRLNFYRNDHLM